MHTPWVYFLDVQGNLNLIHTQAFVLKAQWWLNSGRARLLVFKPVIARTVHVAVISDDDAAVRTISRKEFVLSLKVIIAGTVTLKRLRKILFISEAILKRSMVFLFHEEVLPGSVVNNVTASVLCRRVSAAVG